MGHVRDDGMDQFESTKKIQTRKELVQNKFQSSHNVPYLKREQLIC